MRHMLKIYTTLIMLLAAMYIVFDIIRIKNDYEGHSQSSAILICMLVSSALIEVDRRLIKMENKTQGQTGEDDQPPTPL